MPVPNRARIVIRALSAAAIAAALPSAAHAFDFTPGDLVVSVYGDGASGDTNIYADNAASPITLQELTTSGAAVGQLVLPQSFSGANNPISGEYGSSSEGSLQLSANGQDLTIAGYGVAASTFNANPQGFGGGTKSCIGDANPCYPLGQTASVSGTAGSAGSGVTTAVVVPRVIALINSQGAIDTSTALTGVFNENNPRSVTTVNGSTFYISGQGQSKSDTATQGVFLATDGATAPTAHIYSTVDTRTVSIQNNQLFLSTDSTEGSGVTENVSTLGAAGSLPTGATTPSILSGIKSKFSVTSLSQLNEYDQANLGTNAAYIAEPNKIYLSPENFFLANPTTLYVADSGNPKGDNNGGGSADLPQGLSDGGLQKWTFNGTTWMLDYTLSAGLLNFVPDTTACTADEVNCGTTGLIGLTGQVESNGTVELFATNSTLGDEDQTYLYGIDDTLSDTSPSQVSCSPPTAATCESFTVLDTAAPDTIIRGVSLAPALAPVPEPASLPLLAVAVLGLGVIRYRRQACPGSRG